jgi:hypothetical protein
MKINNKKAMHILSRPLSFGAYKAHKKLGGAQGKEYKLED